MTNKMHRNVRIMPVSLLELHYSNKRDYYDMRISVDTDLTKIEIKMQLTYE